MQFPNFIECQNHLGPRNKYDSGLILLQGAWVSVFFISFSGDSVPYQSLRTTQLLV